MPIRISSEHVSELACSLAGNHACCMLRSLSLERESSRLERARGNDLTLSESKCKGRNVSEHKNCDSLLDTS